MLSYSHSPFRKGLPVANVNFEPLISQVGLELMILFPLSPEFWDYRHASCLARDSVFFNVSTAPLSLHVNKFIIIH
jgi:hypothetical protein